MYLMSDLKKLTDIGFLKAGYWTLTPTGIKSILSAYAESRNVLYCFVSDAVVLYLGKTVGSLKQRMYGYQNPASSQTTNVKGNKNIKCLLADGNPVEIYAYPDNGLLHFGVFHINLAAGLEDSIVRKLKPKWNQTGTYNKETNATL